MIILQVAQNHCQANGGADAQGPPTTEVMDKLSNLL